MIPPLEYACGGSHSLSELFLGFPFCLAYASNNGLDFL